MNLKRLEYINEFLIEQMNHWLLFPIALTVTIFSRQQGDFKPDLLMWVLCSSFPLVFFLLRNKCNSLYTLLFSHVGAAALSFLIPVQNGIVDRILCVGCAAVYMLFSVVWYLKKDNVFSSPMQLPVAIFISCFSTLFSVILQNDTSQENANWSNYLILPLIFSLGLFFIIMYIQQYMNFLNVNKSSAGCLPASEIFHSGLGLAALYTILCVFLMLLVTQFSWFKRVGNLLQNVLWKLMRWILAKLPKSSEANTIPTDEDFSALPNISSFFERQQTFWLWEVLQYVFVAALALAALVLLFKALAKLISCIQGRYVFRARSQAAQEEDAFDIREKCVPSAKTAKKRQRHLGPLSHSERIRKLYKRKLLSSAERMTAQENSRLEIYTAREWERRLSVKGMAPLYEKARYSCQEVSAEDVRRMKEVCRQEQV